MNSDALSPAGEPRQTPVHLLRALRDHLPFAFEHLRGAAPMQALEPASRAVLNELLGCWARDDEPIYQSDIAHRTAFSVRQVRNALQDLEQADIVASVRAGKFISYKIGLRLEEALDDFAWGRDRSLWARGLWFDTSAQNATDDARTPAPDAPVRTPL